MPPRRLTLPFRSPRLTACRPLCRHRPDATVAEASEAPSGAKRVRSHRAQRTASRAPGVQVMGPAPAAMARLVGRWRFQIVLRGSELGVFRRWLTDMSRLFKPSLGKGVRLHVDVDPRHLM